MYILKQGFVLKNFKPIGFKGLEGLELADLSINEKGFITSVNLAGSIGNSGKKEIDLAESFLSPGWIDLHTHIGIGDFLIRAEEVGPTTGVIMLVDAGSYGSFNFSMFRNFIVNKSEFPIKAYINISNLGIPDGTATHVTELMDWDSIDLKKLTEVYEANQDIIKGIKIRASKYILRDFGMDAVDIAINTSKLLKLPLIIHIGEPPAFLSELVRILNPGSLITHCFNGKLGNSVIHNRELIEVYKEGMDKGLLFDIGHGSSSFSFAAAQILIDSGIIPFSISTDIHGFNINGPVYDLSTTMSKLMAAGLKLQQVIDCVTKNPAEFLHEEEWNILKPGNRPYLTAFKIREGNFNLYDANSIGDGPISYNSYLEIKTDRIIEPILTICGNKLFFAENRYLKVLEHH